MKKYGFTPVCPGWIAVEKGSKPANHSDGRRERIESEMQKDEGLRERLKTCQETDGQKDPASQSMDVDTDGVVGTKRKAQGDLDEEPDRSKGQENAATETQK